MFSNTQIFFPIYNTWVRRSRADNISLVNIMKTKISLSKVINIFSPKCLPKWHTLPEAKWNKIRTHFGGGGALWGYNSPPFTYPPLHFFSLPIFPFVIIHLSLSLSYSSAFNQSRPFILDIIIILYPPLSSTSLLLSTYLFTFSSPFFFSLTSS